jgi:hypothetical protein
MLATDSADLDLLLIFLKGVVCSGFGSEKVFVDERERNEGSAKLAIALVVLSRANAANVNKLFCLNELVD